MKNESVTSFDLFVEAIRTYDDNPENAKECLSLAVEEHLSKGLGKVAYNESFKSALHHMFVYDQHSTVKIDWLKDFISYYGVAWERRASLDTVEALTK